MSVTLVGFHTCEIWFIWSFCWHGNHNTMWAVLFLQKKSSWSLLELLFNYRLWGGHAKLGFGNCEVLSALSWKRQFWVPMWTFYFEASPKWTKLTHRWTILSFILFFVVVDAPFTIAFKVAFWIRSGMLLLWILHGCAGFFFCISGCVGWNIAFCSGQVSATNLAQGLCHMQWMNNFIARCELESEFTSSTRSRGRSFGWKWTLIQDALSVKLHVLVFMGFGKRVWFGWANCH